MLSQKEKQAYDQRTRLYKVQSEQQLMDALRETRDMDRVPLIIRTPRNNLHLTDLKPRIAKAFHLGYSGDQGC